MILSMCTDCFQGYKLLLKPTEMHLLRQIWEEVVDGWVCPCPRRCGGRINVSYDETIASSVNEQTAVTLTGTELYQAVNGMGLPDEIPNDVEVVDALLRANQVVECRLEGVEERIYLHELRLSNGTIIHLTAGGRGAQVLKITKGATT